MYCIFSGRVKLYKQKKNGELQVIRLLGPGDVFGYRALFASEPYAVTAEAIETATVCAITKNMLFEVMRKSPDLTFQFLSKLSQELTVTTPSMAKKESFVSAEYKTELHRLYPNPFNPTTIVSYSLSVPSFVTLDVVDVVGRIKSTPVSSVMNKGDYSQTSMPRPGQVEFISLELTRICH